MGASPPVGDLRTGGSAAPGVEADVELLDVTKRFGSVVAVDRLTLRIARGAFYSLLGPSGCGKTTTLRMIAGFEDPTSGEVRIGGRSVDGVPPYRRNVNTVFQHYALFPHMDVGRNVGYGLRQRGITGAEERRRVTEALELVRLRGYEHRRAWELSGGQQQRVALARALINRPTVLLLDEPLGALDLKLRREMQLELKSLQTQVGITFVYVTHDQEEAITMSDRIVVMHDGRVLQEGSPAELYNEPRSRYVAGFLGQSNFIAGRVVEGGPSLAIATPGGLRVLARRPVGLEAPAAGAEVTVAIRPERIRLLGAAGEGAAAEANALVGRVTHATYLGDQVEHRVQVDGVGEIVARAMAPETMDAGESATPRFAPGDQVIATWQRAAALVLTE
ncbi:MAG TPA: ABC transporter ATP-binding protein [Candidatus Limnocylindrales bacterium]|nr:ABC transporter ATP-binding protein [Candidatus Limnocylindrales bacterium]